MIVLRILYAALWLLLFAAWGHFWWTRRQWWAASYDEIEKEIESLVDRGYLSVDEDGRISLTSKGEGAIKSG